MPSRRLLPALRVFQAVTRFLPVAVQLAMVVYALSLHSWMFALMSLASAGMGLGYAVSDLLVRREETSSAPSPREGHALQEHSGPEQLVRRFLTAGESIEPPGLTDLLDAGEHEGARRGRDAGWQDIVRWWTTGKKVKGLPVPIGLMPDPDSRTPTRTGGTGTVGAAFRPLVLDIVAQGPHALVAGTTGSGKSVLLESWCLAMALRYPPSLLRFVFLDFKGGATFRALSKLPHCLGSVSDLSLGHAKRALRAIESELGRRERLVAQAGVPDITALPSPPPRLVIVVDEFNALRSRLPDYMDRLARLASQGRSLAMNLILATQSPMGQVAQEMRTNINLGVCLRLRDRLQSTDLVGTGLAADLPISAPGLGILNDGSGPELFRCCCEPRSGTLVRACSLSAGFLRACHVRGMESRTLFTPPLPLLLNRADTIGTVGREEDMLIGRWDDGVSTHPLHLDLSRGNCAIVGGHGRGKTHALRLIERRLLEGRLAQGRRAAQRQSGDLPQRKGPARGGRETAWEPRDFLAVDDADHLLDPLSTDPQAGALARRLSDPRTLTVLALSSPKLARYPEVCPTAIVFPTGDPTTDLLSGIPAQALADWEPQDYVTPGRAILLQDSRAVTIQITAPDPETVPGPDHG